MLMPFLGGILIGISSSIMLGTLGRITGISGILGTTLSSPLSAEKWRWTFIAGLLAGGLLMKITASEFFEYPITSDLSLVILAGLLVGFGTRLGAGCTSGHGVCGIPRLSKRSILATVIFMTSGMITVILKRMFL